MAERARRIVLASRPQGEPTLENFRLEETDIPRPGPGQMLLRTTWMSLDPYMRGRMSDAPSYAAPVEINGVMEAGTVSEVAASNADGFSPGDLVVSRGGWQTHSLAKASGAKKISPDVAPPSAWLGVMGMPGFTAYGGLLEIGKPKAGETLVVASAAGPVGSLVGQIAKIKGLRAIGIAGGPDKCAYVKNELGFDDCLDHKAPELRERLKAACPKGIDIYFENVGGAVWDAVFPQLNTFARIPVCGLIAYYNMMELPAGPNKVPQLMRALLTKRLTIRGFINTDFMEYHDAFERDVALWLKQGKVKYREDVAEGLENAPAAFMGMLKGANFGKQLVRVAS
jgi:NADPH-dependent curcumin reductase CurA